MLKFTPLLGHTLPLMEGARSGITEFFLKLDQRVKCKCFVCGLQQKWGLSECVVVKSYELAAMDGLSMVVLHDENDRRYVLQEVSKTKPIEA